MTRGEGAEPAAEPEPATAKRPNGPREAPGSISLPRAPASARATPPPVLGSSGASGLRPPPLLDSSSTSGLRPPPLGAAAVSTPADSAGSWPKTDGWDLDEELEPTPLTSASSAASTPMPEVAPMQEAAPTHELAPTPRLALTPTPKPRLTPTPAPTPKLDAAPPSAAEPLALDVAASAAHASEAASSDPSPWLDVPPIQPVAAPEEAALSQVAELLQAAAPPETLPVASAAAWDAPPLLDAAPPEGGTDGVPLLDSASLLGTEIVEEVAAGTSSVPRLPLPGMLRDGPAPRAADFRATPRASRGPTASAMAPLPGMVPPRFREGEAPRITSDTASFVAQVADELIESGNVEALASATDLAGEEVVTEVGAPPPKLPPLVMFADQAAPRPAAERKRGVPWLAVAGLAAAVALVAWLSLREGETPTTVAAAPAAAEPTPPAPEVVAEVLPEPVPAVEPPIEPPIDEEAVEEVAVVEEELAGSTGAVQEEAVADDEALAGSEGASEEAGPASAGRKPSSKSKGSGSKATSSPTANKEPKSEPKAASSDAPSTKALLKRARTAYLAGKGSSAYSLAAKSNRMEPSGEAAEVMALAACLMNDADKAKAALRTVPLLRRGSVRSACKSKHDVRIPL